ncbi:MAG: hypothetical protein JO202_02870 [Ktedonobacteraceae bacterium]|nr:hypothetical protein [Ktedonobacteraceae bacterium]
MSRGNNTCSAAPSAGRPQWGVCPVCGQKKFLSVTTTQYGWICLSCLEALYPGSLGWPKQGGQQ